MDWSAAATLVAALVALICVVASPVVLFRHRSAVETGALRAQFDELIRHVVQNWRVIDRMIRDAPSRSGLPLAMHIEKLRGTGAIVLPDSLAYLPAPMRATVIRLQHRLENLDVEIDEAAAALRTGDSAVLDAVLLHLLGSTTQLHGFLTDRREKLFAVRLSPEERLVQDPSDPKPILYRRAS